MKDRFRRLLLSKMQTRVFELSYDKVDSSSEIFIRRFMNSNASKLYDSLSILDDTLRNIDVINMLLEECGPSDYGIVKYSKDELYWIGYFYRYFSYTYNLSSKQVYKMVKPKELKKVYPIYHTLSLPIATERVLEAKA